MRAVWVSVGQHRRYSHLSAVQSADRFSVEGMAGGEPKTRCEEDWKAFLISATVPADDASPESGVVQVPEHPSPTGWPLARGSPLSGGLMERYELLGLGDVIELNRRRLFQMGILLGIIPQVRPKKRLPGPGGLLLLMS